MVASLLASRILGLLRDTVMASKFGIQLDTDSYRLAVSIPDTIFMLIAGGGLSSAFIPIFSEFIYTDRDEDAWKVFSVVTTICALAVSALIAIAWFLAPQIASFMCAGKTTEVLGVELQVDKIITPTVTQLGRILLPAQFAFLIGSVLLGTLYARKQFAAPALAPNVYNIGIIVGALLGSRAGIGIAGMAWGGLIGAIIGNLILPTLFMVGKGGWLKPSLDIRAPGVKKFFNLLLPVILGFSLPSVCALITQKFASMYPMGINTVLTLSNNLMMAPLGIFGHSLALAVFPVLSQFFAQNRMDMYRDQVSKTLRTTIYLSMPASAVMLALAPQIVNLTVGWGKANDADRLPMTVAALQVYSLAIWAWCMQPILMRGFFSIHQTARPVIIGTIMTAVFIVMCWLGTAANMSYLLLPAATNIAAILLIIALFFGLEKQVGKLDRKGVLQTLGKSFVGSAVMGATGYGMFYFVPANLPKLVMLGAFAFVFCVIGWIYYFVTRKLGMPETDYISRAMDRIQRKKPATPPAA
jgi:putative peptidoglycan lipid II flippase